MKDDISLLSVTAERAPLEYQKVACPPLFQSFSVESSTLGPVLTFLISLAVIDNGHYGNSTE